MLAVLAVAEVATRSWLQSPSVVRLDGRYDNVLPPHVRVAQSREGWSVARTNSLGLLDDEPRVPRPARRVLLLGDSFTEAVEVARRDNYQSVAERLVPGLEIVNAGHAGRTPAHFADWMEDHAGPLAPDLVVVQVWDDNLRDLVTPAGLARVAERARLGPTPPPPPPVEDRLHRWLRRAVRGSALLNVGWQRLKRMPESFGAVALLARGGDARTLRGGPAPEPAPALSFETAAFDPRQEPLLDSLHARIAARSPRLLYLYVPRLRWFEPGSPAADPRAAAFFRRFARRNHVRLVDPTDALRAEFARTGQPLNGFANTVPGQGHLNAAGHRVIGRELARAVVESLR